MKKLMIALSVAAIAVASQAASFQWKTSDAMYTINASAVVDNGPYNIGAKKANAKTGGVMNTTLKVTLALYSTSDSSLVWSETKDMVYSTTGNKANVSFSASDTIQASTAYNYVLTVTGTDTALTGRGKEKDYDYTNSAITWTQNGKATSAASGAQTITTAGPTAWQVSGITGVEPEPTPEPTSAMLLLLGVAGLALKRKQK